MVKSFSVGNGWRKVGNGVVDLPKLGVFAISCVLVLLLDVHLNS